MDKWNILFEEYTAGGINDMFDNLYTWFKAFTDLFMGNDVITNMFNITLPIGLVLTLIYFLIDLEDVAMRQNFSVEYFVRNLTKIVIAYAILSNIGSIFIGFENFIDELVTELPLFEGLGIPQITLESNPALKRVAFGSSAQPAIGDILGYGPDAFLVCAMNGWIMIVVLVVSIKRAMELTVWYVMAPLIFADSYSKKFAGVANKFKRLFAVYMQAPFIMVILGFGQLLLGKIEVSNANWMTRIFTLFVVMGAIMKQVVSSKADLERVFTS